MFKPEVYINNERLDLFEDEKISVVSSVQNIEDISRTFNDFSQSFTVPGSRANNKIFLHYYNATVNDGFDARVRHAARIDISGWPFKVGTIRLENCKVENGHIAHYKITFFGQLIDLKEVIGDDYLSVLDLSDYDIGYNSDNVITGLTTGYSSQQLIYPLISTERQWFYDSNSATTTYEERLANIAWNGSGSVHGFSWTSLRPALKVTTILDAIEDYYGITFSNDFLNDTPLQTLYLWLADADATDALENKLRVTSYTTVNISAPQGGTWSNTDGQYTLASYGAQFADEIVWDVDSSDGIVYTIQLMNGSQVLEQKTGTGDLTITYSFTAGTLQTGAEIYGRIVTTAAKDIDQAYLRIRRAPPFSVTFLEATKGSFSISGSTVQVLTFIPKIKVLDFLKSIIKLYNCVVVPTSSTAFYVNTLDDWYAEGQTYDISQYVDTSEITVNRSKIYREIAFKYQEPQTILADEYARQNSTPYGDLETKLKNADGTPLDGDEFEIEVDFEQMVYEKLLDANDDSETNIVYGLSLDRGLSDTSPSAHIFYGRSVSVSANPISIVQDDGTKAQINTSVWMPSHSNNAAKDYGITFGSEIDEHDGGIITNSLFKRYYQDYIQDSFSIKRRKYDLKAKLPLWLLSTLKLNDRLVINGERFIINQMVTDVTSQMVDFELLNDIYNLSDAVSLPPTVEEETPPNPTKPTPTPTVSKSFSISATGASTRAGGCPLVPNATKYWSGSPENYPTLGNFIYNEAGLTTAYDGGDQYYKIASPYVIRINSSGIVTDIYDCVAGQVP